MTTLLPPSTIAMAGNMPTSGSPRCIEPPLPRQQPVTLAYSSAIARRGVTPFGQRVTVWAVGRGNPVSLAQVIAHPNCDCFLAVVLVHGAGDLTLQKVGVDASLPNRRSSTSWR